MRRTPSILGGLALGLFVPAAAAAQDPTVAGAPLGPVASGAATELEFRSEEPGLVISLVPAGEEESDLDALPGVQPDVFQPLCETPCRLQLPNGAYTLLAGSHRFELTAAGGVQVWDVEDESAGEYWGGVTLVSLGIGGILVGGIIAGLAGLSDPPSSPEFEAGIAVLAFGPVATVVGALLWSWSYGSAELRPVAATPPAVALGPGSLALRF